MTKSIPQIKIPSLMYGLGVLSPFMPENIIAEKESKDNNQKLEFITKENLIEDIPFESYIMNSLKYDTINVEKDTEITLDTKGLIIEANGKSRITVHIKNNNKSEKILGLLSSSLIIRCHKDSDVTLIIIQDDAEQEQVGRTAFFLTGIILENAKLTINELVITQNDSYRKSRILLKEKGAKVYPIHGIFSYGESKVDVESDVDHEGTESESDMKIRAIVSESSHAIVQGDVTIKPTAFGANGYQTEDIILLGKNAIARPIPNLEIRNHDVKCSHGATVSSVDDDTLFYAMTRGIRREDAMAMLISSFLSPVLQSFPRELLIIYEERISRIISESNVLEES